jgi:acetyl-CoA carboxylase, biotin carboxylase subunit
MNTRLQVEHPVTELVAGIDLVREQIRVAAGEPLSFKQEDVVMNGHAIECRVYAEDPENNFLPSPGRITRLRIPQGPGIRDDGGVYEGSEVSIYYDPMISKFAAYGKDRRQAIERMRRALAEYRIGGIKTTLEFFREVMNDSEFVAGNIDTGFIAKWQERRSEKESDGESEDIASIAAALSYQKQSVRPASAPLQSKWSRAGRSAGLGR